MKKLNDQLTELTNALSVVIKKVNQMKRSVNKQGSSAVANRKGARRAGLQVRGREARVRQDTVLDSIYNIIRRSRKGISILQLKSKTALDDRQISNALYKLTKKGLVHTKSRGVYIKS